MIISLGFFPLPPLYLTLSYILFSSLIFLLPFPVSYFSPASYFSFFSSAFSCLNRLPLPAHRSWLPNRSKKRTNWRRYSIDSLKRGHETLRLVKQYFSFLDDSLRIFCSNSLLLLFSYLECFSFSSSWFISLTLSLLLSLFLSLVPSQIPCPSHSLCPPFSLSLCCLFFLHPILFINEMV